jgi:DNA invertase Pin-like site-specific DNA recombinase
MMPIRTLKIALYARVSTSDQRCDLQLNEMKEYCERRGWPIVAEYVDTGWSGSKKSRPQLDKLMAAARKHMFDVVMCWKLDRFGRSVANFVEHLQVLNGAGVRFICISQSIDTDQQNPGSKLLMDIMAAFAEFERSMIRERVKAGLAAAVRRGVKLGRRRKFTQSERDKVIELHLRGKSIRAIGRETGMSEFTVHSIIPHEKPQAAA